MMPTSFKNDSRRAGDGSIFFGQNKFDEKGNQINDFVIEFTKNNPKPNIMKLKDECPQRLRGQHCQVSFDLQANTYMIQDMGAGIGTFLKCQA